MREVAAHRKRRRGEDPGASRAIDLAAKDFRDRQRRCVQLKALRAHVDPANPSGGGIRVRVESCLPPRDAVRGALGAARDDANIFAPFRDETHLGCEPVQAGGERIQCFTELAAIREHLLRELSWRVAGSEPKLAKERDEIGPGIGKVGDRVARRRTASHVHHRSVHLGDELA